MQEFWGKTQAEADGKPATAKPVVHHLFDAAAVACELLEVRRAFLSRLSIALGLSCDQAKKLCAFLAGVHDLGKFSTRFQAKAPQFWPEAALGPLLPMPPDEGHWRYTALLMREGPAADLIRKAFGKTVELAVMDDLDAIAAGHHGQPPSSDWMGIDTGGARCRSLRSESSALPASCQIAAAAAIEALLAVLGYQLVAPQREQSRKMSMLLNGLVTTADWVASDLSCFPPPERFPPLEPFDAENYWCEARRNARKAIRAKGLAPLSSAHLNWPALGLASNGLRPMQEAVDAIEIAEGPNLFIVEDMTGAGKTEAALKLASRLMLAGKGEGVYFALPTMATANAMFGRLRQSYQAFFVTGAMKGEPSLVLAHGKADLARRIATLEGKSGAPDDVAAHCNAWISDNRRKALFADIGAGTIDQAFLAVLRKRFLALRQFALANRILIVDEAHSFDAYMDEEMQALLRLHAMHGGSAIVLSATLTSTLRERFAQAFDDGIQKAPAQLRKLSRREQEAARHAQPIRLQSRAFPLLTQVHGGKANERAVAHFDTGRPPVVVQRIESRAQAVEKAVLAARSGAAVSIICNAVDEAVAVHDSVCARLGGADAAILFHARFAMCDRMKIEEQVLNLFGKDADPTRRAGKILVATQVVEQSLDLDFDLMVSDLAPFDLLVQRAGRLWRHMVVRPCQKRPMKEPRLLVVSDDPDQVMSDKWLHATLGKAAFVYQHPGVLWRTAASLFLAGALPLPTEPAFRAMLDAVYADDEGDLPPCLRLIAGRARGEEYGRRSIGALNVIKPEEGYGVLDVLSNNEEIGTRLGEEQATLRLARRVDERLVPWAEMDGADEKLLWALSEIAVRKALLRDTDLASSQTAAEMRAVKSSWPDFEQEILLLEVGAEGEIVAACGLVYSPQSGLTRPRSQE